MISSDQVRLTQDNDQTDVRLAALFQVRSPGENPQYSYRIAVNIQDPHNKSTTMLSRLDGFLPSDEVLTKRGSSIDNSSSLQATAFCLAAWKEEVYRAATELSKKHPDVTVCYGGPEAGGTLLDELTDMSCFEVRASSTQHPDLDLTLMASPLTLRPIHRTSDDSRTVRFYPCAKANLSGTSTFVYGATGIHAGFGETDSLPKTPPQLLVLNGTMSSHEDDLRSGDSGKIHTALEKFREVMRRGAENHYPQQGYMCEVDEPEWGPFRGMLPREDEEDHLIELQPKEDEGENLIEM
jgi:hypothetical protein